MKKRVIIVVTIAFLIGANSSRAQDIVILRDTIKAAYLTTERTDIHVTSVKSIDPESVKNRVSATGEGDIVRFVQSLPGVSTGAEGSSAIFVRGGNLGGNVTTLDGVQLYGASHLFGFSSVYPMSIIKSAKFKIGGFSGEEANTTDSHIQLETKSGSYQEKTIDLSASNFMIGAFVSAPLLKDKISISASMRISPAQLEYLFAKNLLNTKLDSIKDIRLSAADMFVKISGAISSRDIVSLTFLGSHDKYSITRDTLTSNTLQWNNCITNLNLDRFGNIWKRHLGLSYNYFSTQRNQENLLNSTTNFLSISNGIQEYQLRYKASTGWGPHFIFQYGMQHTGSVFTPASSRITEGRDYLTVLAKTSAQTRIHVRRTTLFSDLTYSLRDILTMSASGRWNNYISSNKTDWKIRNTEWSLLCKLLPIKWLSIEATYDHNYSFNHVLEGMPFGWTMDIIVPSSRNYLPELKEQYYTGITFLLKKQNISIGGFTKKMNNIVYFTNPTAIFSPGLEQWEKNTTTGSGYSKGLEFLWDGEESCFHHHIAYTLSSTDRTFQTINNGVTFPATFDRTHILNLDLSCNLIQEKDKKIGINSFYTFQSGNLETVSAGYFDALLLDENTIPIDVYTTINNYRMPPYIRWDIGVFSQIQRRRYTHHINIGIYNVLNRHNPMMISYDSRHRTWMTTSILPIMPSLYYRLVL